jgi:hypothetical protein
MFHQKIVGKFCFPFLVSFSKYIYGVLKLVAILAALAALGRSFGSCGRGSVLWFSMNRLKREPKSPNGPTAIGMNA